MGTSFSPTTAHAHRPHPSRGQATALRTRPAVVGATSSSLRNPSGRSSAALSRHPSLQRHPSYQRIEHRDTVTLRGNVILGLGWDPVGAPTNNPAGTATEHHDMDVGCVCLGKNNIYEDFVYFNNQASPGILHSGDNRTGEGDGDDEQLTLHLAAVPPTVRSMVVVISCFTGNFLCIKSAFVRLVELSTGRELERYPLTGQFNRESLIVCKLVRQQGGADWKLTVLGEQIGGRCIIDYFHQDAEGPFASLRAEFKPKADVSVSDNKFIPRMPPPGEARRPARLPCKTSQAMKNLLAE
eukprot:FR741891.1.p1 GENE.FR741891.1~~FR741891.1.p1  ORF type:complete len:314 (+),score=-8.60 FR741891.1:53-943(+)